MCPSLLTFHGYQSYNLVNYLIYGKFLVKEGIENMLRIRNRILIMFSFGAAAAVNPNSTNGI